MPITLEQTVAETPRPSLFSPERRPAGPLVRPLIEAGPARASVGRSSCRAAAGQRSRERRQRSPTLKPWTRMRRCLEPSHPSAGMIGLDFHAPRVAGSPFNAQNAAASRVDGKLHRRPIRMICDGQAVSRRLTTARHRASIPADERYRHRPRFVYVAFPIGVIGQDFHVDNFGGR
jgi:hypothetical protein